MAASWYIPTQSTLAARLLLVQALEHDWRAPYCFRFEFQNLILGQERRRALPARAAERVWANLMMEIPVVCSRPPSESEVSRALDYARRHGVSLYDAMYLLLCMENDAMLLTRDARLIAAAQQEGCAVQDVRDPA